jgi:hypothetical protein
VQAELNSATTNSIHAIAWEVQAEMLTAQLRNVKDRKGGRQQKV